MPLWIILEKNALTVVITETKLAFKPDNTKFCDVDMAG